MPGSDSIRAGGAYVQLDAKNDLQRGLDAAAAQLQAFGKVVRDIGLSMTVTAAAITAPITAMAYKFADSSQQLLLASQRTGVSVEALSSLQYAALQTGTDLDTLQTALRKSSTFLVEAARGSEQAQRSLQLLGVSLASLEQMSPEQRFSALADALSRVSDASIRQALTTQIFGRSGTALLPMLQNGAAGLAKWRARAQQLNLVQGTQSVQAAAQFKTSLIDLRAVLSQVGNVVGSAVLPILQKNAEMVTRVAAAIIPYINANKDTIATIFRVASAIGAAGVGLAIFGTSVQMAGKGLSGLSSLVGGIEGAFISMLSPMGLAVAGLAALGGYLIYSSGKGGAAVKYLGTVFRDVVSDARAAGAGIADAFDSGRIVLAARILWNGIKIEFQRGLAAVGTFWQAGVPALMTAWNGLLNFVGHATAPLLNSVGTSWTRIGEIIGGVFARGVQYAVFGFSAIEALAENWRAALKLAAVSVELAFVSTWENIKSSAVNVIGSMLNSLTSTLIAWAGKVGTFLAAAFSNIKNNIMVALTAGINPGAIITADIKAAARKTFGSAAASQPAGPRQKTDLEKSLEKQQADLLGKLSPEIDKRLAENQALMEKAKQRLSEALKGLAGDMTGVSEKARKEIERLKQDRDRLLAEAGAGKKPVVPLPPNLPGADAGEFSLLGRSSAVGTFNASAAFGLGGNGIDRLIEHARNTAASTQKIEEHTRKLPQAAPLTFN